jgi:hypothetical protein
MAERTASGRVIDARTPSDRAGPILLGDMEALLRNMEALLRNMEALLRNMEAQAAQRVQVYDLQGRYMRTFGDTFLNRPE